jgi:hypothetical protein
MNWYNDNEVQRYLDNLLDLLCSLERSGGEERYGSTLVFIPYDPEKPVLWAVRGKPFYPPENQTDFDVEMGVKLALERRW